MKQSDYVNAIKDVAMKTGKDLLVQEGLKSLPFLFSGPLGFLGNMIVDKVMTILLTQAEFAVFFEYIDLRVDAQGKTFSDAAMANYTAQINGTPDEKAKAQQALIDSFKSLVKLSN